MSNRPRPLGAPARLLHWLTAASVLGLMSSGWAIFNAAPFYPFEFPRSLALGGYLTPALRWHFAFMWVLVLSIPAQIALRLLAGRGGPALMPINPRSILREVDHMLRLRLSHIPGNYNHTQRLIYLGVMLLLIVAMVAVDLADGRRVFAPADSNPAAVRAHMERGGAAR